MNLLFPLFLSFVILIKASSAFAITSVVIEGEIVEAVTCKINDNNPIDIDFGDAVAISKIDGSHYAKPLTLVFTCSRDPEGTVTVTINGSGAPFDAMALETNIKELGIRLTRDGSVITLGAPMAVNYPNPVVLMTAPIKQFGVTLLPGSFVAFSTAVVNYL